MIIETIVVTVGVVVVASLGFADRVLKRQAKADTSEDPKAERRRVLERQRDEWIKAANGLSSAYSSDRQNFLKHAAVVDEQLIALANE